MSLILENPIGPLELESARRRQLLELPVAQTRRVKSSPQDTTRQLALDIQKALRKESWGWNFLQLAWTAGPVTYLALQGGYLLGYGQAAPGDLVIYFIGYTAIAGFAAIAIRVLYHLTRGRDIERGTRALRDCLDQLPRVLLFARDLALDASNPSDSKLLAAKHILATPEAGVISLGTAVSDLGGSQNLADAFQRMEVFRRNSLPSRIEEERASIEQELEQFLSALDARSPDTVALLRRRSRGRAPSKRHGRRRTEGFIERALSAETEDDEQLMSLVDVEEVLTFSIELLVGRQLGLITFDFVGNKSFGEAWQRLAKARRRFRSALRSRNSRLRIVAEILSSRLDGVVSSITRIRNFTQLRDEVIDALDMWIEKLRSEPAATSHEELQSLRRLATAYDYLEKASLELHAAHRVMANAAEDYHRTLKEHASASTPNSIDEVTLDPTRGASLRISEAEVGLDESARLELARSIGSILRGFGCWKTEKLDLDEQEALAMAVEILSSIEDHLPLYRQDVQQAIEFSPAPTIESLEPGLSPDVRAGWTAALVDEVETDIAQYALRRIEQQVRFHGLGLGKDIVSEIAKRFGIEEEALHCLNRSLEKADSPWSRRPMNIPKRAERLQSLARELLVTTQGRRGAAS